MNEFLSDGGLPALSERFWQDGFAVVRQAFDPDEVASWRAIALQRRSELDLLSRDELATIVLRDELIRAAQAILGAKPVYFGDSTAMIGTAQGSGFHKDNSDRYDETAPDWSVVRYPIIRFGIYAQRHGARPGGIDFLLASHQRADRTAGQMCSPDIEPGDLVVWNSRTSHSANSPRLRVSGTRVRPNGTTWRAIRKARSEWLYQQNAAERVAFFVSYGATHPLLDRHLAYLTTRTYAVRNMKTIDWSLESKRMAQERGLSLIQPVPLADIPLHQDYHPLPHDHSLSSVRLVDC